MRARSFGGNMLAIVVAIMFILLVLVLGLHTSQSVAVRNVTQAEAELQFRQGFEFELARLLADEQPIPEWVRVTGNTDLVSESSPPLDYGKELFGELPNFDPVDEEHPPGFNTYRVNPKTNDAALKVFQGRYQWLVTQDSGGYAAYAPNGRITLEEARGFGNPTLDDETEVAEAYSAVPVLLASAGDLLVDDLRYGMVYSREGEIELDGDAALGFTGSFPLRAYEESFKTDLDRLRSEMKAAAVSGDKTFQLRGDALQTAGSMVNMLFSDSSGTDLSLSLQQAIQVPFPMIPSFSNTVPAIFYEFYFHVPYPPDFSSFDGVGRDSEADALEVKRLKGEITRVEGEIAALEAEKRRATSDRERERIQDQIDAKQSELDDLRDELRDLQDEIEADAEEKNEAVNNRTGSSPADEPVTRREDRDLTKQGITGWAYAPVFKNMLSLLLNTIRGPSGWSSIAESVVNKVRVVHFGDLDNEPEFLFDNGNFFANATFNIPPGRSFRYQGSMEFEGDLWLQKGSLMHIMGDLTLSDPNGSRDPFKASGKLVLEEGAVLIVDGDVTLEGSPNYGSLWVCSKAGEISPVTTAILADGNVTIPHGSFTCAALPDAVRWVATKEGALSDLEPIVDGLFQDVAPNLAKIAGPFHMRKPFFASYATTFQLTMVPTPVGTVPVPSAVPLPRKNILVPIFRGFTYVYTPAMNGMLGENFVTHTDWWGFGQGTVPVLPKVDPVRMVQGITSVNLGGLDFDIDWEEQLTELAEGVLKDSVQFVIETVARTLVEKLIAAAVPGAGLVSDLIGQALDRVLDELTTRDEFFDQLKERVMDATLGPITGELERWAEDLRDQVEDGLANGYLREVNGPLIYGDVISAGVDSNSLLMSGMLVARNNITVGSRTFVGAMLCLEGDITAQRFFYSPHFTQVSLYKPRATDSNWVVRMGQYQYGSNFNSEDGTGVKTGVKMVRTEGWNR